MIVLSDIISQEVLTIPGDYYQVLKKLSST